MENKDNEKENIKEFDEQLESEFEEDTNDTLGDAEREELNKRLEESKDKTENKKSKKEKKKDKKHHKVRRKRDASYLKVFIIAIIAAVIIALLIVGVLLLLKGKDNSLEEKLNSRLKELAKDFYEVQYYPNLTNSSTGEKMTDEEKVAFAEKFKNTGITIDLASLARIYGDEKDALLEEFKNGDEACDYDNTKIVIYPKEPYNKTDYDIEVNLKCGFSDEASEDNEK